MAKNQTQNDDDQTQDQIIDTKEDDAATATAVKTSEDFDAKLDSEGIDEALPEDDETKSDEDKDTDSETDDTGTAEDKDAGGDETEDKDEDKGDDDALSQNLVDQAIDIGLKMDEISLHKNDAELERTIDILSGINITRRTSPDNQAQTPEKKDAKDKDDEGIKFEDEEAIDPDILKAIRGIEKQNKDLRQIVDRLTGSIEQRNQDEFEQRFDGMIKDLGTDFEGVFGEGSTKDLNKNSGAFRNRRAMSRRMYAIAKGYTDTGLNIPTEKDLFETALFALHRKKMNNVRSQDIARKTDKQKGAKAGKPASSRTGKPPTGIQKAIHTSREFDKLIDTSE